MHVVQTLYQCTHLTGLTQAPRDQPAPENSRAALFVYSYLSNARQMLSLPARTQCLLGDVPECVGLAYNMMASMALYLFANALASALTTRASSRHQR
jgi:hypothetical protein